MTIATFITKVRHTIGDSKATKYTDERLIDLINEGMTDIVKEANIFRSSTNILVENGITAYKLPDDVYFLTRVTQDDSVIPFYSYEEMDTKFGAWESDVESDTISAVVYDQQNMNEVTTYPELNGIGGTYFKLPDGTSVSLEEGTQGPVTFVEGTGTDHTVVVDQDDANYGALVSISYDWFPIKIQYVKKPNTILTVGDDVELDDLHIPVLKYYVSGTVLFDDDRAENTQKGTVLLGKYKDLVKEMKNKSMRNFHRVNRSTSYRTPFNS